MTGHQTLQLVVNPMPEIQLTQPPGILDHRLLYGASQLPARWTDQPGIVYTQDRGRTEVKDVQPMVPDPSAVRGDVRVQAGYARRRVDPRDGPAATKVTVGSLLTRRGQNLFRHEETLALQNAGQRTRVQMFVRVQVEDNFLPCSPPPP